MPFAIGSVAIDLAPIVNHAAVATARYPVILTPRPALFPLHTPRAVSSVLPPTPGPLHCNLCGHLPSHFIRALSKSQRKLSSLNDVNAKQALRTKAPGVADRSQLKNKEQTKEAKK